MKMPIFVPHPDAVARHRMLAEMLRRTPAAGTDTPREVRGSKSHGSAHGRAPAANEEQSADFPPASGA